MTTATRYNEAHFKTYNKFSKDHTKDILKESTYYNYLGDATSFLSNITDISLLSIKSKKQLKSLLEDNYGLIALTLKTTAHSKTSDSWRKLRRALVVSYKAAGLSNLASDLHSISNPVSVSERSHNTKKSRRLIKVTDEIFSEMYENRMDAGDADSLALMTLGQKIGIRPSEAKRLELIESKDNEITIKVHGSKKTLLGEKVKSKSRGLDRTLTVTHSEAIERALETVRDIDDNRIKSAQMRMHRASRKIWFDSEKHFCLYSLRYTFGSNLKRQLYSTEGGRIVAAAVMGHKNTSSISSYGNYRSGRIGIDLPQVDLETVEQVKDDIGDRFQKGRGKYFDVGEAIRKREYVKKDLEPEFSL
ncbi:hypothetical protein [Cobetia sp. AM6]|uniref:hypothetical protein n=1 Tax=Cobetia sp. AM6 TaxID=2661553 RepID=UPI0012A92DE0|nr:hypothetical protein [Cobetia sp. AM6]BBO57295.1 hypothetical protein CLAM6_26060 [Cobetia sp. AM6]